jgi:hypothetical protein
VQRGERVVRLRVGRHVDAEQLQHRTQRLVVRELLAARRVRVARDDAVSARQPPQ